jgi:hypothetical protein
MDIEWISVKDKLPEHNSLVLAYSSSSEGFEVVGFVDSVKLNDKFKKDGLEEECIDIYKSPYFFCSQGIRRNVKHNVTHWAYINGPKA